jgi:hypothetical protein
MKTGWDLIFADNKAWDIGLKNFKNQKLREKKISK